MRSIAKKFRITDHTAIFVTIVFVWITIFMGILSHKVYANQTDKEPYRIKLLNGDIVPTGKKIKCQKEQLIQMGKILQDRGPKNIHILVQLARIPQKEEYTQLQNQGLYLHDYLPDKAWIAAVSVDKLRPALNTPEIRFVRHWGSEDKISPRLKKREFGPWAIDEVRGLVHLLVEFHREVDQFSGEVLLIGHGALSLHYFEGMNMYSCWIKQESIPALQVIEEIFWIEEYPPPLTGANDGARNTLHVDTVHQSPYNLDGQGVNIFVFDSGRVLTTHEQISGRVTSVDLTSTGNHSTNVACTAAGDGTGMARAKGMAPGAWILTAGYDQSTGILFLDSYGDMITDYDTARNDGTHPADLAINSLVFNVANFDICSYEGDYGQSSRMIDRIVRGDETGIQGTYRRYIVTWAAGNERISDGFSPIGRCGGGYGTLPPPASAKNPITVGATNSDYNAMADFSSWGPTDNGRLKPVVVGPGCEIMGEQGIYSASGGGDNDYITMCGTSIACAAVAGVIALILEKYHALNSVTTEPVNAALKALLIHTATDLGPEGPDYMSGYGHVDVRAAIDILEAGEIGTDATAYFHDIVFDTPAYIEQDDDWTLPVTIPSGVREFKISLAWDDVASPAVTSGNLINDLDLELESPAKATHYPWILDPTNPWVAATTGVNSVDNQEQIVVQNPGAGIWTIHVRGTTVPNSAQQSFGLVYSYVSGQLECTPLIAPGVNNGGFESSGTWTIGGDATRTAIQSHSGTYSLKLAGNNNNNGAAKQLVTIPFDAVTVTLSYWFRCLTTDESAGRDILRVEVTSASDMLLAIVDQSHNGVQTKYTTSLQIQTPRWAYADNIDLTPWAGQKIYVQFRGLTNAANPTTFWVDDVNLTVCTSDQVPTLNPLGALILVLVISIILVLGSPLTGLMKRG
ncbi:S8 family serine peptidase [candidate division CSSED10-310 bacterium]|uniref:S8 family serine peptidase n=1 Tax=candidate division CSSED10-310 bacterium TaxID=2855610 RepID=A0ABV6YRS6_UNCC1